MMIIARLYVNTRKRDKNDVSPRKNLFEETSLYYLEDFARDETLTVVTLDAKLALVVFLTVRRSIPCLNRK